MGSSKSPGVRETGFCSDGGVLSLSYVRAGGIRVRVFRRSSPGLKAVFPEGLSARHHVGFTSDEPQGRHADFSEKLGVDPGVLNSPGHVRGSLGEFFPHAQVSPSL